MPWPLLVSVVLLPLLALTASGYRRVFAWRAAGAFLVILGVAAVAPELDTLGSVPRSFLAVSAGFIWAGLSISFVESFRHWRGWSALFSRRPHEMGWRGFSIFIYFEVTYTLSRAVLRPAGWDGVIAALAIIGAGLVLWVTFHWMKLPERLRGFDDSWLARTHPPAPALSAQAELFTWGALLAAVLLVLLSHALLAFGLGAFAFVVAADRLMRQRGKSSPIPLRAILATLSLAAFCFAVRTIAGADISLRFPGILETPFSFAAEASLALVIGLGAWVMLGLWPFHGAGAGSAAAIVGGAFLIRWGNGLIPDGMAHAAPLFAIVAMVAALHAAATGRVGEYAGALGVLAVTAQHRMAWAFFGVASCLALVRLLPDGGIRVPLCPPGLDRRQFGAILLIPILGVALPSMLRGESFQTAVAVLAGVPLVLSMRTPDQR